MVYLVALGLGWLSSSLAARSLLFRGRIRRCWPWLLARWGPSSAFLQKPKLCRLDKSITQPSRVPLEKARAIRVVRRLPESLEGGLGYCRQNDTKRISPRRVTSYHACTEVNEAEAWATTSDEDGFLTSAPLPAGHKHQSRDSG